MKRESTSLPICPHTPALYFSTVWACSNLQFTEDNRKDLQRSMPFFPLFSWVLSKMPGGLLACTSAAVTLYLFNKIKNCLAKWSQAQETNWIFTLFPDWGNIVLRQIGCLLVTSHLILPQGDLERRHPLCYSSHLIGQLQIPPNAFYAGQKKHFVLCN